MSKSMVSVIITNYNYGRYIRQAIDSVLAQTYPSIQIIVVDDGSTDNSLELLASYGQSISLIQQQNQGVVAARNNGATQATGTYLCFLDADDYLAPDYFNLLVQALGKANDSLAIAYPETHVFDQQQVVVPALPWNPRKLLYRNYIAISSLIRKSAFEAVGGFAKQDNQAMSFEDWDLWLSLLQQGYSGLYVPQAHYFYRLHGTGRNQAALQQRPLLEAELRRRHPQLYNQPLNRLYLAIFQTASQLRNKLKPPPGAAS